MIQRHYDDLEEALEIHLSWEDKGIDQRGDDSVSETEDEYSMADQH